MKLISTYLRLAIKVDQIGTSCTNVYDLAGRMIEKQYHTGATPALGGIVTAGASLESTDTFTFDAASRVIATHKGRHDITTEHSYALDSQPLSETIKANGDTYTSRRTYDAANRPLSHTFPNGKTTQWSYTARNLVSTVRYEDELIATNTYDAGLRQTNQNYGNGLNRVITYARQDNLRSTDRVLTKNDLNFSYTYAVDKQVTAESIVADQVENTSFTANYDAGNRLTAWNRAGADENHSQTWDYDDAGNWNSTTKDGDTEGRNHSVSNQITQLDGKAVSHDLKGNLTEYEYDRTDYRVKYDLDNRIVEVKADSETIRYRYDALGRRIISKGDDETVLIWWGDSECAEYEHRASQDAIQNDIMGHPDRLNSVIARDTEDRENRVELQWYHKNYLDHVYAVSDDNGNLIEHYRYTAFGEPEIYSATGARRNTSAIGNTVMWNTRRYDADNGLYYYKYRHYAANIGRWPSRDPIEEGGGVNLYAFVYNDAINEWDYLGMWNWRDPWGGGQGFIPGRNTGARLRNGAIGAASGAASGAAVGAGVGAGVGALGAGVGAAPSAAAGATAGGIGGAGGALGAAAGRGGTAALTHYSSAQGAATINASGQLGRSASSSLWATTGRAAGTSVSGSTGVSITGQAANAFRPVVPTGLFSSYGRFAGFNSAGSGILNLSNGAYIAGGGINGQLARWYGLDALISGTTGWLSPQLIGPWLLDCEPGYDCPGDPCYGR